MRFEEMKVEKSQKNFLKKYYMKEIKMKNSYGFYNINSSCSY